MSEKIKYLLEQLHEELDKKGSISILGETLKTTSSNTIDEAVETEDFIDFLTKVLNVNVDIGDAYISPPDFTHEIDVNSRGSLVELEISLDSETILEDVLPEAIEREMSESSFTVDFEDMSLDLDPQDVHYSDCPREVRISSPRAAIEDFVKNKLEFEVRAGDRVFKPKVTVEDGKFVLEIEPTSTSDDILKRIPDNVSAKQLLENLLASFEEVK